MNFFFGTKKRRETSISGHVNSVMEVPSVRRERDRVLALDYPAVRAAIGGPIKRKAGRRFDVGRILLVDEML